ncbi:MAG: NifB/NifX family molybdenum-iron cluster-binding protein [Bacteroidales bacterium]
MKKIAVPVVDGTLCNHFGHCQEFHLFLVKDGKIDKKEKITPPPHAPGVIPNWLGEQKVTDVIVGGIGQRAIDIFNSQGVNVYAGAPNKPSEEIVENFIKGTLTLNENLCDH